MTGQDLINQLQLESNYFHRRPTPVPGKIMPTSFGSMNYNVLRSIIEELGVLSLNRGAEVGVFEAATSSYLLNAFPSLRMFCVDPFVEYSEHESDKTQAKMSACETTARARLQSFQGRATVLKEFSVKAAEFVEDESLDFVFIDAIHNYQSVLEDLTAWFPKVRPNGLLAGHDFIWHGVRDAVEHFITPRAIAAFFTPPTSDVWFFLK